MTRGLRGGLVPLALVLAGCASTRAGLPGWAPAFLKPTSIVIPAPAGAPSSAPVSPTPAIVQTLTLGAPQGASGRLTLTRTIDVVRGTGAISVNDDLGQWTFSYAPLALHERALTIQAIGIRFQSASGEAIEIDWDDSALLDPTGKRQRVAHRGDVTPGNEAAVWVGDVGFESLPPGLAVTVVLTLRRGDQRPVKTFVFESRPPEVEGPRRPRPISKWVGERFVVLPRPPSRQRAAYEALEVRDKIRRHPTSEEMAGAVLIATSVSYERLTPVVTFVREDTKQQYTGRAADESLEGLAPLADLESARKEWVGKALWLATPDLQTSGEGSEDPRLLPVKRLTRVDVVDVQLGWSSNAPIRFMLRTAGGALGFRDVHTTGTNVPEAQRQRHAFARAFLTQDPRSELHWPEEVWAAIEDARVVVGMTRAQARMSWGDPPEVERIVSGAGREERWTYADQRALVLVDDLVTHVRP